MILNILNVESSTPIVRIHQLFHQDIFGLFIAFVSSSSA